MTIGANESDGASYQIIALKDFPRVRPGDNLAALIIDALERMGLTLRSSDIVVLAQKIVSKAEGRYVRPNELTPSAGALELAAKTGKPPGLAEAVLQEANEILRAKPGVVICEHRSGHIMANAGIDHSNTEAGDPDTVLLLPRDADASAAAIRQELSAHYGTAPGVVISDSLGRPWRLGTVGFAIGSSGPPALVDRRGTSDMDGRVLEITMTGFADAVAAAAVLIMGEGDEGRPVALVRGLTWPQSDQSSRDLLRPRVDDMFR